MKRLPSIIVAVFLPGGCATHDPGPSNEVASPGDRVADWQMAHMEDAPDELIAADTQLYGSGASLLAASEMLGLPEAGSGDVAALAAPR